MTDNKEIERLAKEAGLTKFNVLRGGTDVQMTKSVEWHGSSEQIANLMALTAEECADLAENAHSEPYDSPALNAATYIRSKYPMPKG